MAADLGTFYGAADKQTFRDEDARRVPTMRMVTNTIALCWCFFLPCVIFAGLCYMETFHINYILLADVLVGIIVLLLGMRSWFEPGWYRFLFGLCAIAFIAGIASGNRNASITAPFYTMNEMGFYLQVDPRTADSFELQDAGRILFLPGTHVDVAHAEGVKSGQTYCVAPVTFQNETLRSYEFWAVGVNCCSGMAGDFHCGEYNNPRAAGALRSLDDAARPFFRMAVQQAQAVFNVTVRHPIFLHWTQDPVAEVDHHLERGRQLFQFEIVIFCVSNLFAVVVAGFLLFGKTIEGD